VENRETVKQAIWNEKPKLSAIRGRFLQFINCSTFDRLFVMGINRASYTIGRQNRARHGVMSHMGRRMRPAFVHAAHAACGGKPTLATQIHSTGCVCIAYNVQEDHMQCLQTSCLLPVMQTCISSSSC